MKETAAQIRWLISQHSEALLNGADSSMGHKPAPHRWSKKEIMGHMIDSAQNNIRRFIVAQYQDKPHIVYNQDQWVSINQYQTYDVKTLVALWSALNTQIAVILEGLSPEMEKKECMSEDIHSIKWLAEDYVKHLKHHLHQVLELDPVAYP